MVEATLSLSFLLSCTYYSQKELRRRRTLAQEPLRARKNLSNFSIWMLISAKTKRQTIKVTHYVNEIPVDRTGQIQESCDCDGGDTMNHRSNMDNNSQVALPTFVIPPAFTVTEINKLHCQHLVVMNLKLELMTRPFV